MDWAPRPKELWSRRDLRRQTFAERAVMIGPKRGRQSCDIRAITSMSGLHGAYNECNTVLVIHIGMNRTQICARPDEVRVARVRLRGVRWITWIVQRVRQIPRIRYEIRRTEHTIE